MAGRCAVWGPRFVAANTGCDPCGLLIGGRLSTQVAWQDPRVKRLVLLAPALQVAYPLLSSQAVWLRYVRDWVDLDPPYMSVRYQSMPTQAVAQTYQLSRELRANLKQRPLKQPTFLLLAAHDLVIDAPTSLAVFSQHMPHPPKPSLGLWCDGQALGRCPCPANPCGR